MSIKMQESTFLDSGVVENISAVFFSNTPVDVFAQSGICQSLKYSCTVPFEQVAQDKF